MTVRGRVWGVGTDVVVPDGDAVERMEAGEVGVLDSDSDSESVTRVRGWSDRSLCVLLVALAMETVVVMLSDVASVEGAELLELRDVVGGGTRLSSIDTVEVVATGNSCRDNEGVLVFVVVVPVTFSDVVIADVNEPVVEISDCLCGDGLNVALVVLVVAISVTFCDVMTDELDEMTVETSDRFCNDGLVVTSDRFTEMLIAVAGVEAPRRVVETVAGVEGADAATDVETVVEVVEVEADPGWIEAETRDGVGLPVLIARPAVGPPKRDVLDVPKPEEREAG